MASSDLVRVEKRILRFQCPQAPDVTSLDTLTVTNISNEIVSFKVKTTNQQRYVVRPNVGTIPIGETVDIDIGLQSSNMPPQPGISKDKFLLRVAPGTGTGESLADFWSSREGDAGVKGLKFKVEFFIPIDSQQDDDDYSIAMARVAELQEKLDSKNLELARLKTELAETHAETDRVLRDAPSTPLSANKVVSDPFGGVSIAGLALMLLLFLILVNVISRVL